MFLSAFCRLFQHRATLGSRGFHGGRYCQAPAGSHGCCSSSLQQREAQGCQAAPAKSACVHSAEGTLSSSSRQPSRQWDRGRADEQGVTAGSWAWLRFLKGECSTTPRRRSLQGVTHFVTIDRIVPLGLGTQWQLQEWTTLLKAAHLTPLPLPIGCDIYMANTQKFSFMGNSRWSSVLSTLLPSNA